MDLTDSESDYGAPTDNSDSEMDMNMLNSLMNNVVLEYEAIVACTNIHYSNSDYTDKIDYHFDENNDKHIEETVTEDIYERVMKLEDVVRIELTYHKRDEVIYDSCLYKNIDIYIYFN